MKGFILAISILSFLPDLHSQLSDDQLKAYKKEAIVKVNTFTSYLSRIASKETKNTVRQSYIGLANSLFRHHPKESMIEVSNTNTDTVTRHRIKNYLQSISKSKYDIVVIKFDADGFYITDFKKVKKDGDWIYYCTATVTQHFCGKYNNSEFNTDDGSCAYIDTTQKQIEIEVVPVVDFLGRHYIVLLGDITVKATNDY